MAKKQSHLGNSKSPRGCFSFSTWGRKNSSEISFHSSEVSFHSSEVLFLAYVENFYFLRRNLRFATWIYLHAANITSSQLLRFWESRGRGDALYIMSSSTSLLLVCCSCVVPDRAIRMHQPWLDKLNAGSLQ